MFWLRLLCVRSLVGVYCTVYTVQYTPTKERTHKRRNQNIELNTQFAFMCAVNSCKQIDTLQILSSWWFCMSLTLLTCYLIGFRLASLFKKTNFVNYTRINQFNLAFMFIHLRFSSMFTCKISFHKHPRRDAGVYVNMSYFLSLPRLTRPISTRQSYDWFNASPIQKISLQPAI